MCKMLSLLVGLMITLNVHADLLYSIDTDADVLVTIDPATGAVTVVGPLGHDVADVDLTMHDGQLYGLNSIYPERVELHVIDTDTGAATSPIAVTNGGAMIINGEGLTSICGDLVIGFHDPTTAAHPGFSNALGTITRDGAVENTMAFGPTDDFDALCADATGFELRSIDAQGLDLPTLLYVGDRTPSELTFLNQHALGEGVNDILLHGASAYMIAHSSPLLYRTSPLTGALLETVSLDRPGRYFGLAAEDPGTCAGDVDRGGSIGFQDLTQILNQWGPCASCPCPSDLDGSGSVGFGDLTIQLNGWGTCAAP